MRNVSRMWRTGLALAAAWALAASVVGRAVAQPLEAPPGHESSTGVAVAGGGFITLTGVWVTAGLTDSPYYHQWTPDPGERQAHREASARYTVMLLEVANLSALTLEGFVSANVRVLVDGERVRPVADEALARAYPSLLPPQHLERVSPRGRLLRAYAFPKAPGRPVALVVRAIGLYQERRQIGQLPEFQLRFDPARLAFPP